jgi:hypothetical protein
MPSSDRHRDLVALLEIHELHTAPIEQLGDDVRRQNHPEVAARRWDLEAAFLGDLETWDESMEWELPDDPVDAMYAVAGVDLVPDIYEWLAADANTDEFVEFLSLEGGPDAGFDDLVAACQIGLRGEPKVELARNFWDEMGHGALAGVHTELHHRLSEALELRAIPRAEQPVEALERSALGSFLATNRWLQPEMVGSLGITELQAGPRCEQVLVGLQRIDAPAGAYPFYEVHAEVDPIHGKAWVENVVAPLAEDPRWARGIVRGARWRVLTNRRFFAAMDQRFAHTAERRAS